jgi:hypothetical protein
VSKGWERIHKGGKRQMGGRNPSQEYGEIEVIKKPRGKKNDRLVNFLDSTVCEYAKFNSEFYRAMKIRDLTFGWGESQNQSIIWHSMRKSRYRALPFSEHSYWLRGRNKRLDYWVLLKDIKTVLWVEYKHATALLGYCFLTLKLYRSSYLAPVCKLTTSGVNSKMSTRGGFTFSGLSGGIRLGQIY